jgi:hypothetical protein
MSQRLRYKFKDKALQNRWNTPENLAFRQEWEAELARSARANERRIPSLLSF